MTKTKDELITENTELLNARNLLEEGIDSLNKTINDLHNKLDAQDKIINTQALEIARLKEEIKHLENQLLNVKQQFQIALDINTQKQQKIDKTIEYIKLDKVIKDGDTLEQITNYEKNILEILGDKE